jgi:hypothetical protein
LTNVHVELLPTYTHTNTHTFTHSLLISGCVHQSSAKCAGTPKHWNWNTNHWNTETHNNIIIHTHTHFHTFLADLKSSANCAETPKTLKLKHWNTETLHSAIPGWRHRVLFSRWFFQNLLHFVKGTYFNRLLLGRCQIYVADPSGGRSGGIGVQGESYYPGNLNSKQQPSNQNVDEQVRRNNTHARTQAKFLAPAERERERDRGKEKGTSANGRVLCSGWIDGGGTTVRSFLLILNRTFADD